MRIHFRKGRERCNFVLIVGIVIFSFVAFVRFSFTAPFSDMLWDVLY